MSEPSVEVRPATPGDYEAVVSFTGDTWDRVEDYVPDVYHDWLAGDGQVLVAQQDGSVVGLGQAVLLSETEAWLQGMRVAPAARGVGVATAITETLFDWARAQGAVVARNVVFSWNPAGLGQSRAAGFEPVTAFRLLRPDPAEGTLPGTITDDTDAAWAFWSDGGGEALSGLGFDLDESWALRRLSPGMLERAANETALLVDVADGTRGMAYRTRTVEGEPESDTCGSDTNPDPAGDAGELETGTVATSEDDADQAETETVAEYGAAVWADLDAARRLLEAIAVDARRCGADRTRVLIPDTPTAVSDGAVLRADPESESQFVLASDLTG